MKQTVIDESILISYLNGSLDAVESSRVEEWYMESGENQAQLEELYFILFVGQCAKAKRNVDAEGSLTEFRKKIRYNQRRKIFGIPVKVALRRLASIAALVGLFAMGGYAVKKTAEYSARPFTIMTRLGERAHIVLPDGSDVWLNSCSKVEYVSSIFSRERKVKMHGEAYFEVKKARFPFVVSSNGLVTRVLGTKFNIRANDDEEMVTTTLLEGSVYTSSPVMQSGVMLKPNQQLHYDTRTGAFKVFDCGYNTDEYVGWIEGKLYFNQDFFGDIAQELERYYNVSISFTDENLRHERFSCDFETSDNIRHILSTLALTNKFDYWIKGKDIVIFNK